MLQGMSNVLTQGPCHPPNIAATRDACVPTKKSPVAKKYTNVCIKIDSLYTSGKGAIFNDTACFC